MHISKTITIGAKINYNLYDKISMLARNQNTTLSNVIITAVKNELARVEREVAATVQPKTSTFTDVAPDAPNGLSRVWAWMTSDGKLDLDYKTAVSKQKTINEQKDGVIRRKALAKLSNDEKRALGLKY